MQAYEKLDLVRQGKVKILELKRSLYIEK